MHKSKLFFFFIYLSIGVVYSNWVAKIELDKNSISTVSSDELIEALGTLRTSKDQVFTYDEKKFVLRDLIKKKVILLNASIEGIGPQSPQVLNVYEQQKNELLAGLYLETKIDKSKLIVSEIEAQNYFKAFKKSEPKLTNTFDEVRLVIMQRLQLEKQEEAKKGYLESKEKEYNVKRKKITDTVVANIGDKSIHGHEIEADYVDQLKMLTKEQRDQVSYRKNELMNRILDEKILKEIVQAEMKKDKFVSTKKGIESVDKIKELIIINAYSEMKILDMMSKMPTPSDNDPKLDEFFKKYLDGKGLSSEQIKSEYKKNMALAKFQDEIQEMLEEARITKNKPEIEKVN